MNKIPYGSKPNKPKKKRSLLGSLADLVQAGIDRTTEVTKQDKARQKELSGLRALNEEYTRRRNSDEYGWPYSCCAVITFLSLIATVAMYDDNWPTRIAVGIIVSIVVGVAASIPAGLIEGKLIKRAM